MLQHWNKLTPDDQFKQVATIVGLCSAIIAIIGGAIGVLFWLYQEVNIREVAVAFTNPTERNPMAVASQNSRCYENAMMAAVQRRQAQMNPVEAERLNKADIDKCLAASATHIDESKYVADVSFTNDGPGDSQDLRIYLGIKSSSGAVRVERERTLNFLAAHERGLAEQIPIPFRPVVDAVCISYKSGPLRRSFLVVTGEPVNASLGVLALISSPIQRPISRGTRWLFGDGCKEQLIDFLG